ncbi:hypothetical protein Y1Q_0004176 [Alligator mississippiensis]|uniref:Uncharacterized protein n=1 Tax=Alligator mississippiensis TaxID=8496 RepID=A0A151PID9_ALLMI|nr:hypothetical protein Y1Q_0004176 [Alligator mississippiensis]
MTTYSDLFDTHSSNSTPIGSHFDLDQAICVMGQLQMKGLSMDISIDWTVATEKKFLLAHKILRPTTFSGLPKAKLCL